MRTSLRDGDPSRIGRYRLTARLGAGGMGVVYLGTAKGVGEVAVKVLRADLADDAEFRIRFRREVATLGRVQGVCTVRVIEADTESDRPFLVTEYADGPSLSEWVAAHGPLGGDMLHALAAGLAEALTAIHAAGVVHRDLKPGNVLLTPSGPKVIDFGIAQALDATAVTRTGMVVGSLGFIAPEQISGQAGQPADVFTWALTVAFAATGEPPFGIGPTEAVIYRILHQEPDIATVPDGLRPLVAAALAKNPQERPAAPALLAQLITPIEESAGQATQVLLSRTWMMPQPALRALPVLPAPAVAGQRPKYLALAVAAVVLVAVILGAFTFLPAAFGHHAPGVAFSHGSASAPSHSSAPTILFGSSGSTIQPGYDDCEFTADDGNELVMVYLTYTVCDDWATALTSTGQYWTENGYSPPDSDYVAGVDTIACALSLGDVTLIAEDGETSLSNQYTTGVAKSVCDSAEQDGWKPMPPEEVPS